MPAKMSDSFSQAYADALAFLFGRINYEQTIAIPYCAREMNLDRMRGLMEQLGNPQDKLPIIHIAGTKGKGSTAAMIGTVLTAARYRVGLYTSPHLTCLEERFAVDGQPCTREELIQLTEILRDVVAAQDSTASDSPLRPTFFDVTTAMGFLHFARRKVDIAVVEVGMGGRLDSTNICQPLVSVITSISFDHMKQLGNTLAAIAAEKAGIIKPGVPVVSGVTGMEPASVISQVARERGSQLFQRDRDFFAEYQPAIGDGPGTFSYHQTPHDPAWTIDKIRLGMLGQHQAMNASVALAVLSRLATLGWAISSDHCRRGLETAHCPARIEVVSRHPTIIIDTAHNDASIRALISTLNECFSSQHRALILAVSRDKDVATILRELLPQFNEVILTQFTHNPRGLPVTDLATLVTAVKRELSLSTTISTADHPQAAWETWRQRATPESLLCITGSFFLAAELTPFLSRP